MTKKKTLTERVEELEKNVVTKDDFVPVAKEICAHVPSGWAIEATVVSPRDARLPMHLPVCAKCGAVYREQNK